MSIDKETAILLLWVVCLHVDTGCGLCVDLDVTGCRTNPQFCQDPLLAEVTCPVMCNRCPSVQQTTPSSSSVLECYSCNNVKTPSTCNKTQLCGLGQSCFMDRTVTAHDVSYDMGCLSSKMCTLSGNVPGIVGRSIETRQQPSCHECCTGSLCNIQLCSINDCSEVLKLGLSRGSGVYRITPWNTHREVEVYCDMDTEGGGWTVFQRRWDGSVAFNRIFVEYERGFGSFDGEFWTGLDLIHLMTIRANMTLRLDVSLPNGTTGFDVYSGFYNSPPDQYNFNVDRRVNSSGTYDRDVDNRYYNCAGRYGGGWWFNGCFHTILNGPYSNGYFYYSSFTQHQRLKTSKMMFRVKSSN